MELLQLTTNNELYRNISYRKVCMSTNEAVINTEFTIGGLTPVDEIKFSQNELIWNKTENWATPITRLPDTMDDRVNIFVYPTLDTTNASGLAVNAVLKYNIPFSQYKTASVPDLTLTKDANGRAVYMAKDVSVPDFVSAGDFTGLLQRRKTSLCL
jgi:hypothetical protein